jgi:hypothetical protein
VKLELDELRRHCVVVERNLTSAILANWRWSSHELHELLMIHATTCSQAWYIFQFVT